MRNDIALCGWQIECESDVHNDDFHESIFFCGNGRQGIRGYLPCQSEQLPLHAGLFMAGIFEEIKGGITDIVHLPTPVCESVHINGKPATISGRVKRSLHLKTGLFTAEYTLQTQDGGVVCVRHERFAALDNPGCIVQRSTFCTGCDAHLEIKSGVSLAARNNPVPDDQVKTNDEILCLFAESAPDFAKNGFRLSLHTPHTGLHISQALSFIAPGFSPAAPIYEAGTWAALPFCLDAESGKAYTIEKLCFMTTSRDQNPAIQPPGSNENFETLLRAQEREWAKRWQAVCLPSLPTEEENTAARYLSAQLIMNGPAGDASVSIGARGLTHPRYKGCYFWDTDFFLLPFYVHTHPQTAQNLVRYRIRNLPAARRHAKKTSAKGARYPWMAAYDGSEQCESWDIGLAEVHITADVVFSIDNYIRHSGDTALYPDAAEVYIETARFWCDRYTRDEKGHANLLFVKGPDEYCGITSNNLFTNMLVKHNLHLAIEAAAYLQANDRQRYAKLSLSKKEANTWAALERDIPLPQDPVTGRLRQDDTFHLLEIIDPASLKSGGEASYHNVSFDRLQRYRVIKQADLLLLMTRLPHLFTREQKQQAWEDYEPLCLHDSTLSFASHALFAAQNGYTDAARQYLEKALFLDLRDLMGNTGGEGLHLACYGEAWQALMEMYGEKHSVSQ